MLNLQKEKTRPLAISGLCLPNCVWHRRCSSNHKYLRNYSHPLLKPIRPNSILPRCPNHAIIKIPLNSLSKSTSTEVSVLNPIFPGWVSLHVSFDQSCKHCQHGATPISDGIFLLRRQQCQRQQYTPSMANVFIPFPSLQMFLWSSLLLVLKQVRELKLSNFDILLIENRKFANVSSTNGNWLVSFYPWSDLIVSFYLWNAYALVF